MKSVKYLGDHTKTVEATDKMIARYLPSPTYFDRNINNLFPNLVTYYMFWKQGLYGITIDTSSS